MIRRDRIVPLVILTLVWIIQAVRITRGVDFNDEMQYYGELVSLLEHGRLFANDLFIQQNVYLLLFPILKPYVWLFGTAGLIVAARVVFALFVLWVFGRVRRTLDAGGASPAAASVCALACTFAVPFLNMYSVSYNTVAVGLVAVSFAEFFAWRVAGRSFALVFWTSAIALLAVAYPPLAATLGLTVAARLWSDGDLATVRRLIVALSIAAVIVAVAISRFVTIPDLTAALAFSRAVSVGTVFRAGIAPMLVVAIAAVGLLVLLEKAPASLAGRDRLVTLLVTAGLMAGVVQGVILERAGLVWLPALMSALVGLAITAWLPPNRTAARRWITVLFLASGAVMALSSANGFRQIQAASLLAAPMYFVLAVTPLPGIPPLRVHRVGGWLFGGGLIVILTAFFLANPYQDVRLWQNTSRIDDAPMLRHVRMSAAKADAVRAIRGLLADIPPGSRLMVLGAQPWIYFATGTSPDTDMIFMHSDGAIAGQELLAARLVNRRPQFLVLAGAVTPVVQDAFDALIRNGPYVCDDRAIGAALEHTRARLQTFHEMLPVLTVCRR